MVLRTSSISIFIVIPSAGDDINVRTTSIGPIDYVSSVEKIEFC